MASVRCDNVHYDLLQPAASETEYALHLAALEWSLAEPIIISGRGDIKSEENWRGRFEPYEHQVQNLITFCRRLPVTLLADDVGLGKTISAGLVLSELIVRKRVNRALVICPAILGLQWEEELHAKFRINAKFAKGADFDDYWRNSGAPVLITTYDTARNRLGEVRADAFDMLILDEAHKLRNLHGTAKPPEIAERVRSALRNKIFKYVLMLTATPIQNRVWDLYSLIDLLTTAKGHRNPLGQPHEFQSMYVTDAAGRKINQFRAEQFRSILGQYVVRTRREDAKLQFPSREVVTRKLPATDTERKMQALVAEHIGKLNALAQISLSQSMMSSPHALAAQLENMAGRDSKLQAAAERARSLADMNPKTAKLEGFLKLIRELRQQRPVDWRVVVFTVRKETQNAIGRALQAEGIAHGFIRGGQASENHATIKRFWEKHPAINVIISTDAGAEGVNLQVGNVLVNYDLPWNPMIVEQRIGRVQRLGTTHERVIISNLAVANSVEERVVARLLEKLQVIAHTIGDIETILEAAEQEEEGSFEELIRKLVVDSLRGVDVEEAARKQAESIERAKDLMEKERKNLDEVLGDKSTRPDENLKPPKVVPAEPSMRAEDFVIKALQAEGARIQARDDDTLDVTWPGKPSERITFKSDVAESTRGGVFMGNPPKLYLPGRPAFERLIQRWLQRSGHYVRDLSSNLEGQLCEAAAKWCATIPDSRFVTAELKTRKTESRLQLSCRVTAANGVDKLEKLLTIAPSSSNGLSLSADELRSAPVFHKPASAHDLNLSDDRAVTSLVAAEPAIREFCGFYEYRLNDELGKCGNDKWRRQKLESDLAPKVFAEVVGMQGVRFDVAVARTKFLLDGEHEYGTEITLLPGLGRVLWEPERKSCEITQRVLPDSCLSQCVIGGRWATTHLLAKSEESGRLALPEFAVACAVSGKMLLIDEVWESALSGKRAAKKCFLESPVSRRRGLPEDFEKCEFSGADVLRDEVATSEVSGKAYRKDESGRCAVTNKVGHSTEFVKCTETGDTVVSEQIGESAISGNRVRRDLLVSSQRPPHRQGLPREMATCSETGLTLLSDEVDASAVSGKLVDRTLLVKSEVTGERALPREMVTCTVTGQRMLPCEARASDVSGRLARRALLEQSPISRRWGLPNEVVQCEITGDKVLKDELMVSDESGRKFRKDQSDWSQESGKVGHITEFSICEFSRQRLLNKEVARSSASGKICARTILVSSEKNPGRLAAPCECITCSKTGRRLIADETGISSVSGKTVDRDLLVKSAVSDGVALREELLECGESGKVVLPDELAICQITEKRVLKELLGTSDVSGKSGLSRLLVRCEATGKRVLPDELAVCELTGRHVLPTELATCSISHKRVLKDQLLTSAISGSWVLPEHAVRSPLTKRVCLPTEAVRCGWLNEMLPRDEVSTCRLSGLSVAREFLNSDNELEALRDLLDGSNPGKDGSDQEPMLLAAYKGQCSSFHSIRCLFSPDGRVRAVCGEARSLLGFRARFAGAVTSERDARASIVGRTVWGRRTGGKWALEI